MKRLFCLIAALCLLLCSAAHAEAPLDYSSAIVAFDRTALDGWTPGYSLSIPGVLLELSHAEGMVSVSVRESAGLTPEEYLSQSLDLSVETLVISDAQISGWKDGFDGRGRCLSFSYTYPEGDEAHLYRSWTASMGDLLIELSADTWGADAGLLMDDIYRVFIDSPFSLTLCENPFELIAALSDVITDETGRALVQLSESAADSAYYPLSPNAVILFPNPDEPTTLYPVAPDAASLSDAIWTYEENSDSPAVFYFVIEDNQIVYMEYSLML